MTLSDAAVKKLLEVQQYIKAHPSKVYMDDYIRGNRPNTSEEKVTEKTLESCGTVCCIAGWLGMLDSMKTGVPVVKFFGSDDANRILGLYADDNSTDSLFFDENWPEEMLSRLEYACKPETYAAVVCDRIDQFIEEHTT